MQDLEALGTIERRGETLDIRFERHYPRPPETVWSALTDPTRLADWMGAARIEPHVGGRIDLILDSPAPMTGRIRVWEPPSVLEFSWSNDDAPDSVIRFELFRDGDTTRLVFTQKGVLYARSGLMMPGWHVLFSRLGSLLEGAAKPQSSRSWRQMQGVYVEHYQLQGVLLDIPTPAE